MGQVLWWMKFFCCQDNGFSLSFSGNEKTCRRRRCFIVVSFSSSPNNLLSFMLYYHLICLQLHMIILLMWAFLWFESCFLVLCEPLVYIKGNSDFWKQSLPLNLREMENSPCIISFVVPGQITELHSCLSRWRNRRICWQAWWYGKAAENL